MSSGLPKSQILRGSQQQVHKVDIHCDGGSRHRAWGVCTEQHSGLVLKILLGYRFPESYSLIVSCVTGLDPPGDNMVVHQGTQEHAGTLFTGDTSKNTASREIPKDLLADLGGYFPLAIHLHNHQRGRYTDLLGRALHLKPCSFLVTPMGRK